MATDRTTPADAVGAYIAAKDGNRPYLLERAFVRDAAVTIDSRTGAISFPPVLQGRTAIADALVRGFAQGFENVYTFCLAAPPADDADRYACAWLVAMSERAGGAVRVGHGRYDWTFAATGGARALTIEIDGMQTMPGGDGPAVLGWAAALPYPWCRPADALRRAPPVPALAPILAAIGDGRS
ncbi:MAG: hypothetical protein AB7O45_10350 [Alphaproteobacteria bacterium]